MDSVRFESGLASVTISAGTGAGAESEFPAREQHVVTLRVSAGGQRGVGHRLRGRGARQFDRPGERLQA
jgi:hypothetical protein